MATAGNLAERPNRGDPLAKPNYQFQKRQKELEKKKKQEEKRKRKLEKTEGDPDADPAAPAEDGDPPVT